MLDSETKRKIDSCRDILVGKLPDPKSQIEQITIALIYKFMDDMDKQSEELGGKAKFFTGEFEKYSWDKLVSPKLSGHEAIMYYNEALLKMNQNKNIPQLFRDIFKNAYLPYRDPETLKSFLKEIDWFSYDHSEKLGDAFEYLLSVMGSQGDAGQFRTPRNIIDFIVKAVDPDKNESLLDPACGTAGFLISAYKHILQKHKDKNGKINLSPDEKKRLVQNITGYDISPDMVRLSLVNLYLHGFPDPKIFEYDTLSSEERWNEYFEVILANPPFMTPKGGIRPHKRFSIQANRSEVLFVDYIHEHLTPNGKAGIVVPEGIIFQSGIAYKQLRKMLVENSLYAVVSLPAGVFNPYSGVKTSVLLLDKSLAKKTKDILFIKIENDGFGLGAQRREVSGSNLPMALEILEKYKKSILDGKNFEFETLENTIAHLVSKDKIEAQEYNLSGDRYKEAVVYDGKWPLVELGEVCEILGGYAFQSSELKQIKELDMLPVIKIGNLTKDGKLDLMDVQYHKFEENLKKYLIEKDDVLVAMTGATVGKVAVSDRNNLLLNQRVGLVRVKENISKKYVKCLLLSDLFYDYCQRVAGGGAQGNISPREILQFEIPLPPLEVQERIVEEIESYQNIIDGAKKVVESYKPSFKIDPEWDVVELGEVCEFTQGVQIPQDEQITEKKGGYKRYIYISDLIHDNKLIFVEDKYPKKEVTSRDLIMVNTGNTSGKVFWGKEGILSNNVFKITYKENVLSKYLYYNLSSKGFYKELSNHFKQGAQPHLGHKIIAEQKIPLPSIEIQKEIVAQIEEEQKLVDSNKQLIEIFEKKIKDKISEVWGE